MHRLEPYTHVIFDLDGTLVDSEQMYTEATQAVIGEFGVTFDPSIKQRVIGRGATAAAQILIDSLNLPLTPQEFIDRREPHLRRLFPNVEPLPGVVKLVQALAARGVPMAVATSSPRKLVTLKSQHHDWFDAFDVIVCGDDPRLKRSKPAPDIFLLAAKDLGAEPGSCLVFEDAPAGVEAAVAAGMQVVAIPMPMMDRADYRGAHIIDRYDDLDLSPLSGSG